MSTPSTGCTSLFPHTLQQPYPGNAKSIHYLHSHLHTRTPAFALKLTVGTVTEPTPLTIFKGELCVLVTGGSGFLGAHLLDEDAANVGIVSRKPQPLPVKDNPQQRLSYHANDVGDEARISAVFSEVEPTPSYTLSRLTTPTRRRPTSKQLSMAPACCSSARAAS
jgi:hypothetical protein